MEKKYVFYVIIISILLFGCGKKDNINQIESSNEPLATKSRNIGEKDKNNTSETCEPNVLSNAATLDVTEKGKNTNSASETLAPGELSMEQLVQRYKLIAESEYNVKSNDIKLSWINATRMIPYCNEIQELNLTNNDIVVVFELKNTNDDINNILESDCKKESDDVTIYNLGRYAFAIYSDNAQTITYYLNKVITGNITDSNSMIPID